MYINRMLSTKLRRLTARGPVIMEHHVFSNFIQLLRSGRQKDLILIVVEAFMWWAGGMVALLVGHRSCDL